VTERNSVNESQEEKGEELAKVKWAGQFGGKGIYITDQASANSKAFIPTFPNQNLIYKARLKHITSSMNKLKAEFTLNNPFGTQSTDQSQLLNFHYQIPTSRVSYTRASSQQRNLTSKNRLQRVESQHSSDTTPEVIASTFRGTIVHTQ